MNAQTDQIRYDHRGTPAEKASMARKKELAEKMAAAGWSAQPTAGHHRVFFSANDTLSLVELSDEEVAALREVADQVGVQLPSQFDSGPTTAPPSDPGLRTLGLSNDSDQRISKAVSNTYPYNQTNLRRMGMITTWDASGNGVNCTAVRVGRRLLLTAAHCTVQTDGSYPTIQYWARLDGNWDPYLEEDAVGLWWDAQWGDNNCEITYNDSTHDQCVPWDWSLILLRDDAYSTDGHGDPGWMGYQEPTGASQLNTAQYYGDGYPGCEFGYSPPYCVAQTVFGEVSPHSGLNQQFPDPGDNNFYTYFKTGIDTSPGQSGAGFYRADNVVQGIVVWQDCSYCTTGNNAPNGIRSMTPWLHGFISTQRTNYP